MPTQDEKNLVLNRFMRWEPKHNLMRLPLRHKHDVPEIHEKDDWCAKAGCCPVPDVPFNYYADTPEARERTRLLKDEFVRRTDNAVLVKSYQTILGRTWHYAWIVGVVDDVKYRSVGGEIESHAILDAIYEAIK